MLYPLSYAPAAGPTYHYHPGRVGFAGAFLNLGEAVDEFMDDAPVGLAGGD